jgi:hypothetical protein
VRWRQRGEDGEGLLFEVANCCHRLVLTVLREGSSSVEGLGGGQRFEAVGKAELQLRHAPELDKWKLQERLALLDGRGKRSGKLAVAVRWAPPGMTGRLSARHLAAAAAAAATEGRGRAATPSLRPQDLATPPSSPALEVPRYLPRLAGAGRAEWERRQDDVGQRADLSPEPEPEPEPEHLPVLVVHEPVPAPPPAARASSPPQPTPAATAAGPGFRPNKLQARKQAAEEAERARRERRAQERAAVRHASRQIVNPPRIVLLIHARTRPACLPACLLGTPGGVHVCLGARTPRD